jgi:hypothetical protein
MHRHYPDPQVLPSPHSRGHQQKQHQAQPEHDGSAQQHDGNSTMSDDYDLGVGLAGALK